MKHPKTQIQRKLKNPKRSTKKTTTLIRGVVAKIKAMDVKTILILIVILFTLLYFLRNALKSVYLYFESLFKSVGSTMTNEKAQAIASQLKESFANYIPYSSYSTVKALLSDITLSDYYKIKNAFGLVARDFVGQPTEDLTAHFYTDKNLTEWLVLEISETDKQELRTINPIFKEIL